MSNFAMADWISIVSTIATLLMVIATWKMARATQLTLEEQNKPYVIVYPQQQKRSPTVIEIVIENIGSSSAYDIKFTSTDNLYSKAWGIEKSSREAVKFVDGPFVSGIHYLQPSGKRILYWGQFAGISESLRGKPAEIVATFTNSAKKIQYSTTSILDIKNFEGVTANDPIEVQQLKALELIPRKLDNLITLLDKKLRPQAPETTYMWAYITWFLLKDRGFPKGEIFRVGRDAGLAEYQIESAEREAHILLREFCPELCPKKD